MCFLSQFVSLLCLVADVQIRVKRNENFGKLQAGYLFPEVSSYTCHAYIPLSLPSQESAP